MEVNALQVCMQTGRAPHHPSEHIGQHKRIGQHNWASCKRCCIFINMSRPTFCRAQLLRSATCSASDALRMVNACQQGSNLAQDISANLSKAGDALEHLQANEAFASTVPAVANGSAAQKQKQKPATLVALPGSKKDKHRKDDTDGEGKKKKKKQKQQ